MFLNAISPHNFWFQVKKTIPSTLKSKVIPLLVYKEIICCKLRYNGIYAINVMKRS